MFYKKIKIETAECYSSCFSKCICSFPEQMNKVNEIYKILYIVLRNKNGQSVNNEGNT